MIHEKETILAKYFQNFFRIIKFDLGPSICGRRIERIFQQRLFMNNFQIKLTKMSFGMIQEKGSEYLVRSTFMYLFRNLLRIIKFFIFHIENLFEPEFCDLKNRQKSCQLRRGYLYSSEKLQSGHRVSLGHHKCFFGWLEHCERRSLK